MALWKKLKERGGESLLECMAALLVVSLTLTLLPVAVATAAKINREVRENGALQTVCTEARSQPLAEARLLLRDTATGEWEEVPPADYTAYEEEGYVYYAMNN